MIVRPLLTCGLGILGLVAAAGVRAAEPRAATPAWTCETGSAAWRPRDSQGELVYDGRLWILGGWFDSWESPPRDVWSSVDGRDWKRVQPRAAWRHGDLPMTAVFRDRMWLMGGWTDGRLPTHSASNAVWSSVDGVEWRQETAAAGWSPRLAAAVVEFRGRLWILGGTEDYYFGDASSLKNDVWSTADGITWRRETVAAGWSPRAYHQAAVLGDRIYVCGGGNYVPEYRAANDVWSSADGVSWRQETAAAPWPPRIWFSMAVYRDHLWILGGASSDPKRNLGDVWHSRDGRDWRRFDAPASWSPRHEHSTFVFRDRMWVVGGMQPPLTNDVWSLHLPADWQP